MDTQREIGREELNRILEILHQLEKRVARIEKQIGRQSIAESSVEEGVGKSVSPIAANRKTITSSEVSLEFKIGEYWLAHIGTVVLLLGIAFFISYRFETIPSILTSLLGYIAVAGILALSRYWQKTYQYLSRILFVGGFVLLYFATLRLHFFTSNPVLISKALGLAALVAALTLILFLSIRRQSELLTGIALFLCYSTSLISDTTHFALIFITLSSVAAVYILIRYNWQTAALLSLVMAYMSHLLWLLNNPLLGNPIQAISEHHNNLIYLFIYGALFAGANLFRNKSSYSESSESLIAILNGLGFYVLSIVVTLTFFKPQLGLMNLLISIFCISMATLYWIRHQSIYSSAIYACFGYMVLSIAIFTQFKSPDYFIWLGWQSLLVISTAIWFRSRIIIVVNIIIYLGILLAYLRLAPSNDFVNLSYAFVALTSARVLNWKKERLELKTDMIRNAYLASAFVIVLYGLNHAVPSNYVSLSWLGAALFYFAMSRALKNIKYRWMAILTIFAMVVRVFVIDMARLEAAFRMVLFLAIGIVLLVVSLIYSKHRKDFLKNKNSVRPFY
ncbi:MAG: hypothetical protein ACE5IW_07070 [bacterium]